ncbi:MAG: plastocyanin/azurin family copper-binding protein [Acidimicrobiia bacterium]
MSRPRAVPLLLAALLAVGLGACGGDDDGASSPPDGAGEGSEVRIASFAFAPETLTVDVGATVTWTNDDGAAHSIEATDGSFVSESLAEGDTFEQTFDAAGERTYRCGIHQYMRGTVVVG